MKIIHFGVMAMVSLIMISGLMVPITMEFADEIHSTESNDYVRYSLSEVSDNKTITLEIINNIGYINGREIGDEYNSRMIMFSNTFIVRYTPPDETTESNSFEIVSVVNGTTNFIQVSEIIATGGEWTGKNNDTVRGSGTYEWMMVWNKNGSYGASEDPSATKPIFVNADATVYVCGIYESNISIKKGTLGNMSTILSNGTENTIDIIYEQHTTEPNVFKITDVQTTLYEVVFTPIKYDVITSMDTMTKVLISLSPLFLGIILFAAMGVSLIRLGKLE